MTDHDRPMSHQVSATPEGRQTARSGTSQFPHSPPGSPHFASDNELLHAVQTAVEELVWVLARRNNRRSADMLEKLSSDLLESSEEDRRRAIRKARGEAPPPNNLERARQELHRAYGELAAEARLCRISDFNCTAEKQEGIAQQIASALALLEDEER